MSESDYARQYPDSFARPSRSQRSSTPPVPPAGQPTSGYGPLAATPDAPTMGVAGPQPPAKPRRNTTTILFGVGTVVFLVAAVALGMLYLSERSAHSRTQMQVTANQNQIEKLQKDFDSTKAELKDADSKLADLRKQYDELQNRNTGLQKCANATDNLYDAESYSAWTLMESSCSPFWS